MTRRELGRPNKAQQPIAALRIIIACWRAVGLSRIWAKMRAAFDIKRVTVEALFSFIIVAGEVSATAHNMNMKLRHTLVPVSTGLALITCSYIFRRVPPAGSSHGNPIVTLTAFIFPHHFTGFTRFEASSYFLGQLLGSFSACGIMWILLYPQSDIGTTIPQIRDRSIIYIILAIVYEALATFIWILTRLLVFSDDTLAPFRGIVVGCAACLGSFLAGPVSCGSMNPFRSLTSSVVSNIYDYWYIYWIGPPLGGILAGLLFRAISSLWDDSMSISSGGAGTRADSKED